MSKISSFFSCTACTYQSKKWLGKCPGCAEWGTLAEQQTTRTSGTLHQKTMAVRTPQAIATIERTFTERITTSVTEWDRVCGGGIVPGSFIVLTGDPGIGKSTLLLQIADQLSHTTSVLYISSEESLEQIKLRADRIGCGTSNVICLAETDLETIILTAKSVRPTVLIIDSLQNCSLVGESSVPGTIAQLREAAFRLLRLAKDEEISIIATGHVTKEGVIAGPKLLEHIVDVVFYLQCEERLNVRILRAVKNRFGTINELGFFAMEGKGLVEVPQINRLLLQEAAYAPGAVLVSSLEGSRPLLIELQALTIASKFGMPQRVITGVDQKQVLLIAAILEKYLRLPFSSHDIFFKIGGGIRIKEQIPELGIACALLSSFFQKPLPEKTLVLGEINVTGRISKSDQIAVHLNEAEKFGIERCIMGGSLSSTTAPGIRRHEVETVFDLMPLFE